MLVSGRRPAFDTPVRNRYAKADPPTRLLIAQLPFEACQGAWGRSGCERVGRLAGGGNDAIHGLGSLVWRMAGKILAQGIAKESPAAPLRALTTSVGTREGTPGIAKAID